MQNDLPGLRAGAGETRAPDRVVQAALQHDDEVFARGPLRALGLFHVVAELPLQQSVGALDLLLFAQLQAVSGELLHAPRLAVLPRNEVALFDGALLRKTTQAF